MNGRRRDGWVAIATGAGLPPAVKTPRRRQAAPIVFALKLAPLRERTDDNVPMSERLSESIGNLGRPPSGISGEAR